MYEPSRTEKTILKTLNNILNANKNYFDTLKFKLITDHSARIRKKELYPKQQNSTKNALNYLTVVGIISLGFYLKFFAMI